MRELLRRKEFLRDYAISNSTFYREIAAGRLRVVKRGKSTLVPCEEAERWAKTLPVVGTAA